VARKIGAVAPLVDAWLAADPDLKASVIHERLVAEHGFTDHYQRVKLYVAEARQRLAREHDGASARTTSCISGEATNAWVSGGMVQPRSAVDGHMSGVGSLFPLVSRLRLC
jgi:hypothetical protein